MVDDFMAIEDVHKWYNDDDIALRSKAVMLTARWSGHPHPDYGYPDNQDRLAHLLGYRYYDEMLSNWNDDTRRKLEMLVSPHGYAVYKAMLIRKEV